MRRLVTLSLAAYAALAALAAVVRGSAPLPETTALETRRRLVLKTVFWTLLLAAALGAVGGLAVMYSGIYNIAAIEPHVAPVQWALETGRTRSVRFYSQGIEAPSLREPQKVARGFELYRDHCEVCHGAPGVPRQQLGVGINPTPPPLMDAVARWSDPEIYWILRNGLKMTGMPAFGNDLTDSEQWAVVAFVRRLAWLSPADYRNLSERTGVRPQLPREPEGELAPRAPQSGPAPRAQLRPAALLLAQQPPTGERTNKGSITDEEWLPSDDHGLRDVEQRGNRERGRALLREYGCAACHFIPRAGTGMVGPSLQDYAERHFIAGQLVNTPANTAAFIVDPKHFRPATGMPNVGASEQDAWDMTAYLFSLGRQDRVQGLKRTLE